MTRRSYSLLFLTGLAAVCLVALFQHVPGYMDADYYYAGGLRLAGGQGFSELFLWNYLDDPAGLPHPSHAYWMPLASLLAAAGMKLSGLSNFNGARLGFLLAAAFIPPLTAALSYSLTGRRDQAIFAGLLAAFPIFYLSYLGTTDNFGLYMLLGGLWFLVLGCKFNIGRNQKYSPWFKSFLLGLLAGLMHLARSDGIIWLFLSLVVVISEQRTAISDWGLAIAAVARTSLARDQGLGTSDRDRSPLPFRAGGQGGLGLREGKYWGVSRTLVTRQASVIGSLFELAIVFLGYLLIMGPWMLRNLSSFGTLLSPQGMRALWLVDYNELYSYPATLLTPSHWLASGFGAILSARWIALGQNLQSALAVQGYIFLTPLILIGLWKLRRDLRIRLGIVAWLLTLLMMTVVFPFQGWRGGFFHSGAALQLLWLAAAPVGLEAFVSWGSRVRGWQSNQAERIFRSGLLFMAVSLSIFTVYGRVVGSTSEDPSWAQSNSVYIRLEQALVNQGAPPSAIVAVNNPAGYYIAATRRAIPIPDGNEQTLLAALRRYNARYVLLEVNHPPGLDGLYSHPEEIPGLHYLTTVEETRIFIVEKAFENSF